LRIGYYGEYLGLGGNEWKLGKITLRRAMRLALFIRHEGDQVNEAEMGKYVERIDDMGNVSRISGKT
jgi:hypothetical protein